MNPGIKICTIVLLCMIVSLKVDGQPNQKSVDKAIFSFLLKKGDIKIDSTDGIIRTPSVYKVNLIDSSDNKTCGVYFFRIMSSTSLPYLCLKESDGKVRIIEKYYIDDCLGELLSFYQRNIRNLTSDEKIQCAKGVLEVINRWQNWVNEVHQGHSITK